jgi:hypothetical protein
VSLEINMPYTAREYPEFSWSHSRARLLEECQRRYLLKSYVASSGWSAEATTEARLAYRLSKLTTLPMVLGLQVHERAKEIASAIRDGYEPPSLAECREQTAAELNRVWQGSRDLKAFLRSPKRHPMLLESYYHRPISNESLARVKSRMGICIENLVGWPGWQEVNLARPEDILVLSATDPVPIHDVPVYAAPDLVTMAPDGVWQILDWKTGDCAGVEDQLATYALYLRERGILPGFDGTARGRVVRLDVGEDRIVEITPVQLERAAKRIRDSVWRMRGYVTRMDIGRNEPLPRSHFPLAIDRGQCDRCPFAELCSEDLASPKYFGPF